MFALFCFFFFKQKTAYEMRISDWSSDVCSSDLAARRRPLTRLRPGDRLAEGSAAGGLPADPPAGLCRARLRALGGRHGADPRAADAATARRAGDRTSACRERVGQYV